MKAALCVLAIAFVTTGQAGIAEDILKIITKVPIPNVPPTTVEDHEVTFYFFDRTHPTEAILLTDANWGLINTSKHTVYQVHGWTENRNRQWYADMTAQYLIKGDYQVIQVDWSGPASAGYAEAAQNTRGVGKIIARHVLKTNVPLSNVHLVGHSLGGQTVGFAGKQIQVITGNRKVRRITGLDAAGPLFIGYPDSEHLNPTDAEFVDTVHTDSGVFGYPVDDGQANFYPNGGTAIQPGCLSIPIINIDDVNAAGDAVFCSHHYSWKSWIATINNPTVQGTKCSLYVFYLLGLCKWNQKVTFGESVPFTASGKYFFDSYNLTRKSK